LAVGNELQLIPIAIGNKLPALAKMIESEIRNLEFGMTIE